MLWGKGKYQSQTLLIPYKGKVAMVVIMSDKNSFVKIFFIFCCPAAALPNQLGLFAQRFKIVVCRFIKPYL